ncbi:MAG: transposase, partial [Candidatus Dormibacteria bacterium]
MSIGFVARAPGRFLVHGIQVPASWQPPKVHQPRGYGRVRMAILTDASAASLHPFVTDNVEPGTTVITDAWQGYRGIERLGYTHDR